MENVTRPTMLNDPPPLPPKTRRSMHTGLASLIETTSPVTATVISSSSTERRYNISSSSSGTEDDNTTLASTIQRQQSSSVSPHNEKHVVKIRINPGEDAITPYHIDNSFQSKIQVVQQQQQQQPHTFPYSSNNNGCIRININEENMIRTDNYMKVTQDRPNPYFFYGSPNGIISSGQSSPSDTLDSGTCSDLDGSTPPPLPKKQSSTSITVTVNGNHHKRNCSLTSSGIDVDSDDDGSNISCDSLNSHELNGVIRLVDTVDISSVVNEERQSPEAGAASDVQEEVITPVVCTPAPPPPPPKSYGKSSLSESISGSLLPDGLLQDIRERTGDTDTMLIKTKSNGLVSPVRNDSKIHQFMNTNVQIVEKKEDTKEVAVLTCMEKPNNARINSPVFSTYEESLKSSLPVVQERTYEDRRKENACKEKENADKEKEASENKLNSKKSYIKYDEDKFYKFHLNEHFGANSESVKIINEVDESFAGYKDYLDNNRSTSSTIKSAKGTVRGVKNRVRAGIATFLQVHTEKNYKEKEVGKVIVYTTTMGVVRATFHDCLKVKQILRTLMVKYEERDVMSREVQAEIRDRMSCEDIVLPQLFVEGQHIGDAETVERLNETGELRRILKPFKSADACTTCPVCGGYRLLPCSMCNGSKKSMHRNEFTAEFVALKCMKCDEVGLIKCYAC